MSISGFCLIFFRVSISPEFEDEDVTSCDELTNFNLSVPNERRVISYSAFVDMTDRYREDYNELRRELRVPSIFDFAIVAESLPVAMEPQFGIPDGVEVMAQDRIIEVLRPNGTVINERFTLKIW